MSKAKKELKMKRQEYTRQLQELNSIRAQLDSTYAAFNCVTDPDMLDACIFEISALKSRYNHAVVSIKNLSYWS